MLESATPGTASVPWLRSKPIFSPACFKSGPNRVWVGMFHRPRQGCQGPPFCRALGLRRTRVWPSRSSLLECRRSLPAFVELRLGPWFRGLRRASPLGVLLIRPDAFARCGTSVRLMLLSERVAASEAGGSNPSCSAVCFTGLAAPRNCLLPPEHIDAACERGFNHQTNLFSCTVRDMLGTATMLQLGDKPVCSVVLL